MVGKLGSVPIGWNVTMAQHMSQNDTNAEDSKGHDMKDMEAP
jgi:hypothetical protein